MIDGVLRWLAGDGLAGILAFQAVVLLVVLSNAAVLVRPRRPRPRRAGVSGASGSVARPAVSLLVPARNESANVGACVRSLLAQTYPRLEVIVLDDRSEDDTRAVLEAERVRAGDGRLVVLAGEEPPAGWTGKNWACHQLSLAARGDVLLFADADTVFTAPEAVDRIVGALRASRADLLSGLPRQVLGTPGEALLVPLFYWAFMAFTPLAAHLVWRRAPVARAVGQLMAFRRAAYDAIGGHAAVRASVVDDLDLARAVARAGLSCRILDATEIVACRMYRNGREAAAGFAKNLFAAFGYAILPYAFVWGFLAYAYLAPVALLALHAGLPSRAPVQPALLATVIGLALVQWTFTYARLRLPLWPALAYPVTLAGFFVVAVRSFVAGTLRRATWKGRAVERPPTRWI